MRAANKISSEQKNKFMDSKFGAIQGNSLIKKEQFLGAEKMAFDSVMRPKMDQVRDKTLATKAENA